MRTQSFIAVFIALLPYYSYAQPAVKDSSKKTTTYTYVGVMPKFSGDVNAEIFAKLRFPDTCLNLSTGRCVATFTVEPTGLLSELNIARSSGCPQLDSEIIRVLKPMTVTPRWIPGRQNGRPAAVRHALPVIVHLDD